MTTQPPNASLRPTSRRRFLHWLIGGALGLSALAAARATGRFLTPPLTSEQTQPVAVPNPALAVGGRLYVADARAYLLRDSGGYFALSAICTHLGCLVDERNPGFQCPCHDSRYDDEGHNLTGPAPRPLDHLAVSWTDAGDLTIDPGLVVSAEDRLPPAS